MDYNKTMKRANTFGLVGDILSGVGNLANVGNQIYQGSKGRVPIPIGNLGLAVGQGFSNYGNRQSGNLQAQLKAESANKTTAINEFEYANMTGNEGFTPWKRGNSSSGSTKISLGNQIDKMLVKGTFEYALADVKENQENASEESKQTVREGFNTFNKYIGANKKGGGGKKKKTPAQLKAELKAAGYQ